MPSISPCWHHEALINWGGLRPAGRGREGGRGGEGGGGGGDRLLVTGQSALYNPHSSFLIVFAGACTPTSRHCISAGSSLKKTIFADEHAALK